MDILERIEKMCDPDQDDGEWVRKLDITKKDDQIVLRDVGWVSHQRQQQAVQ